MAGASGGEGLPTSSKGELEIALLFIHIQSHLFEEDGSTHILHIVFRPLG